MNDTVFQAVTLIIPLIIAIVFHEVAHGWVARALGDPTAAEQNRLSLNPLRHVDPVGTILVPGALALMKLPVDVLWRLELGLLVGTPGLAALTLMTSAFTAGLRATGALAGLLLLPLAVPILIFGAGMIEQGTDTGALKLLAAVSLLLTAAA